MSVPETQQQSAQTASGDWLLEKARRTVILLHGVFEPAVFEVGNPDGSELFVMEGRPSLESAEVTCRELLRRKLKPTLIADNMAGFLFCRDLVKETWIAYQTADQDGALCPIGSLILGVLGKRHNVPVRLYPASQVYKMMGKQKDIFYFKGIKVAPQNIKGYVPLVEWLPKKYITQVHTL